MPATPIAYHRPHKLTEALTLLQRPEAQPLAGGTWLLATEFAGEAVDLQELGLNQINWDDSDQLSVGAMTRLADLDAFLAASEPAQGPQTLLHQAIHYAGPNTRRHAATIGGTIAAHLPDSELLAALLLLEAQLAVQQPEAAFTLSLADYLAAPEPPPGLITAVAIPFTPGYGDLARVARTPADDPIVAVLLWQPEDGAVRLAATGIADRPVRLPAAEQAVRSGLSPESITQAAAAAQAAVVHPGDFRGDAAYRADMAAVLARRLLNNRLT